MPTETPTTTTTAADAPARFVPANRRYYTGNYGRALLAMAGEPCRLRGYVTLPAGMTAERREVTWAIVRFASEGRDRQVRPRDLVVG